MCVKPLPALYVVLCFGCLGKSAAAKACSRCKVVHFCSKECQVESWPLHKQKCQVAQVVSTEAVASPSSGVSWSSGKGKEEEPKGKGKAEVATPKPAPAPTAEDPPSSSGGDALPSPTKEADTNKASETRAQEKSEGGIEEEESKLFR